MNEATLFANLDRLHTTPMGAARIKNNLNLATNDVVKFCHDQILNPRCKISHQGKNWYCASDQIIITINASCFTIITAHLRK